MNPETQDWRITRGVLNNEKLFFKKFPCVFYCVVYVLLFNGMMKYQLPVDII